MTMFQKAIKTESKLRLAIAGPSGSGKTYSALAIGTALGSKVAVVDTEHGSAAKYADLFDFDVLEMHAPYSPNKYITAIEAAQSAGYDVLIMDSMSHAWNGAGGMLEMVEQVSKKYRGNSYAAWGEVTPIYQNLIESIVAADLHVISTMRSKQDYILVEKNGKQTPQKVGMAPVQRDGFEYEFDVFFDMDIENNAVVQKTRCPQLNGQVISKPGKQVADILKEWLQGAPAPEKPASQPKAKPVIVEDGKGNSEVGDAIIREMDDKYDDMGDGSFEKILADTLSEFSGMDSVKAGLVADRLVQIGTHENPHAALNSMRKWEGLGDKALEFSTPLLPATAVTIFNDVIERHSES